MLKKPDFCKNCILFGSGEGFIHSEGICSNGVLIVGESAGYHEIIEELPFRPSAPAGSILHRIIKERGKFQRSEFGISNLIRCQPPNNQLLNTNYEYEAINKCRNFLDEDIEKYKPKVILATGSLPFKHLVGLEGYKLGIKEVRGYVFRSSRYPDCLVVPTFHSSYLRRGNSHLIPALIWDLLKAVNLAKGKLIEGKDFILNPFDANFTLDKYGLQYITEPSEIDALEFLIQVKENPNLLISYDIETEKTIGEDEDEIEDFGQTITQIQFSSGINSGIAMPFNSVFIPIAKDILASSNPKCGHNVNNFDNPYLFKQGFEINGRIDDTLNLFHHYQADLPLGLQFVSSFVNFKFAWKHYSGENLPFYGIADVDSCQYIMDEIPKKMKARGLWEGYDRLVNKLWPILVETSNRGLPINRIKQIEFAKEIDVRKKEIELELRQRIPDSFTKYKPSEGYVREPKKVTQAKLQYQQEMNPQYHQAVPFIELKEDTNIPTNLLNVTTYYDVPDDYIFEKTGFIKHNFNTNEEFIIPKELIGILIIPKFKEKGKIERWAKPLYFNPNSSDQVSDFIKYKNHRELADKLSVKIAKEQKSKEDSENSNLKDNVSTSKTILKILASKTGCVEYDLFVEYRELTKMKGTYAPGEDDKDRAYKPGLDGRVHTTFTFRPNNGQLSSRKPNIQNFPVHSTLAEKFKACIESPKGFLIASLDYRGFHNRVMGFLSGDESYLRLADLDTHSFVTGYAVDYPNMESCLDLDNVELSKFLNEIKNKYKSLRNGQVKRIVHGTNYGLSEEGCYTRFKEDFNPSYDAVLKNWGKKRKNPLDTNPKTKIQYWVEQQELEGKARVRNLFKIIRNLFPKVFEWQAKTLKEADMQSYLQTPFGFRRWFMAASDIKYDRFGNIDRIVKGEQGEEALAFPVANNAHCHMRDRILLLDEKGLLEKARLINCIHDSLVFEVREDELELLKEIKEIMEGDSEILVKNGKGFSCSVDIKIGVNLRDQEEYKI